MTQEEQERLYDLIENPPPGSKVEAAKKAGINLRVYVYLLSLTPTQRVERMQQIIRTLDRLTE
jgi:hypothetical protein